MTNFSFYPKYMKKGYKYKEDDSPLWANKPLRVPDVGSVWDFTKDNEEVNDRHGEKTWK
jgi:hypothetical protein